MNSNIGRFSGDQEKVHIIGRYIPTIKVLSLVTDTLVVKNSSFDKLSVTSSQIKRLSCAWPMSKEETQGPSFSIRNSRIGGLLLRNFVLSSKLTLKDSHIEYLYLENARSRKMGVTSQDYFSKIEVGVLHLKDSEISKLTITDGFTPKEVIIEGSVSMNSASIRDHDFSVYKMKKAKRLELFGSKFYRCDLRKTDLRKAVLNSGTRFHNCTHNRSTRWPESFDPKVHLEED